MSNLVLACLKKWVRLYKYLNNDSLYRVSYRIIGYFQSEANDYIVQIQIRNKHITFYSQPSEILKDDSLVNQFSPCDIRTLTYLAMCTLNAAEYEIVAQRLSENNSIVFAMKKSGTNEIILKSASEIIREQDIISRMSAKDAAQIGYAAAINN